MAETLTDNGTVEVINAKPAGAASETGAFKINAGGAPQLDGSDAVNGLVTNANAINVPGNHAIKAAWHASDDGRGGKTAHDSTVSATSEDASAFKPNVDHHGNTDPEIKDIAKDHLLRHPADSLLHMPAQLDDNGGMTDGANPAHPHSDVNQLDTFKFADDGSAHPGTVPHDPPTVTALSSDLSGDHGLAAPSLANTVNVPGTVMSDAASDKFIFGKSSGHDTVADHKPDTTEIDHTVSTDIQHLLATAHDTNAVSTLDPNHATAPQDMTKVQLPHHHGDFQFA
jgi:hypothetical protein